MKEKRHVTGTNFTYANILSSPGLYFSIYVLPVGDRQVPIDSHLAVVLFSVQQISTSLRKAEICVGIVSRKSRATNVSEQWVLGKTSNQTRGRPISCFFFLF